jgi:predicted CxxxxCH...CXXCH cytochrome family protein
MGSGSTTAKVRLYEAAAPAGSLKSLNATTATFDATAKTCSGVYCHSSGQATPTYSTTPSWLSTLKLACDACHANPPRYANGGAGTATANGHLSLAEDGYETGHFLGLLGPWHTSKHGGGSYLAPKPDASPITCETCHYDTTDPAGRGPSGFYWLNTSGNYNLPGGADPGYQASIQCGYCHSASGITPAGAGRVLPLRHVNGKRDVAFDARTANPALPWVASPNNPLRPQWMTVSTHNAWWDLTLVDWRGTTVQFDLVAARYDPVTKNCTNVACHQSQGNTSFTGSTYQTQFMPLQWGMPIYYYTADPATGRSSCTKCHRT